MTTQQQPLTPKPISTLGFYPPGNKPLSTGTLTVLRKFNSARDAVTHDYRQDRRDWVIAFHHWGTGWQELVFENVIAAHAWAIANGCTYADRMRTSTRRTK